MSFGDGYLLSGGTCWKSHLNLWMSNYERQSTIDSAIT